MCYCGYSNQVNAYLEFPLVRKSYWFVSGEICKNRWNLDYNAVRRSVDKENNGNTWARVQMGEIRTLALRRSKEA